MSDRITIGINFYYCCKESEYQVYTIPKDEDFIKKIDELYEGMYTEIFISEKFEFIWNKLLEIDCETTLDSYVECEYQFLYIICQ